MDKLAEITVHLGEDRMRRQVWVKPPPLFRPKRVIPPKRRPQIPYDVQVEVFFRDGWLCSHCRRPTIFHLALKELSYVVSSDVTGLPLAYWNPQWRRDSAPLLDQLGASVDHVESFAKGGKHDISNFATICSKCNARKGTRSREEHIHIDKPRVVKGKYGEPTTWDGLASVFVYFARRTTRPLTASEKGWLAAFEKHFAKTNA